MNTSKCYPFIQRLNVFGSKKDWLSHRQNGVDILGAWDKKKGLYMGETKNGMPHGRGYLSK